MYMLHWALSGSDREASDFLNTTLFQRVTAATCSCPDKVGLERWEGRDSTICRILSASRPIISSSWHVPPVSCDKRPDFIIKSTIKIKQITLNFWHSQRDQVSIFFHACSRAKFKIATHAHMTPPRNQICTKINGEFTKNSYPFIFRFIFGICGTVSHTYFSRVN